MSFISESDLHQYRSERRTFSKALENQLNESYSVIPKVFLSHKHGEFEILQDVIAFLKEEGVDVYVDWMDESMPPNTNADTAVRLKRRIKRCNKFILVATQSAIDSKWCNWELGLGDAAKYPENIALFPIDKNNKSFVGSEYLNIYPYIEYRNGQSTYKSGDLISEGYYVRFPKDNNGSFFIKPLKEWLMTDIWSY